MSKIRMTPAYWIFVVLLTLLVFFANGPEEFSGSMVGIKWLAGICAVLFTILMKPITDMDLVDNDEQSPKEKVESDGKDDRGEEEDNDERDI